MGNDIKKAIGKRLKTIRKQHELTQDQYAQRIGISRAAYTKIESGVNFPAAQHLISCKEAFGVSLDWLLTGESDTPQFGPLNHKVVDMLTDMAISESMLHHILAEYYERKAKIEITMNKSVSYTGWKSV